MSKVKRKTCKLVEWAEAAAAHAHQALTPSERDSV
jgi:hypothetical protein